MAAPSATLGMAHDEDDPTATHTLGNASAFPNLSILSEANDGEGYADAMTGSGGAGSVGDGLGRGGAATGGSGARTERRDDAHSAPWTPQPTRAALEAYDEGLSTGGRNSRSRSDAGRPHGVRTATDDSIGDVGRLDLSLRAAVADASGETSFDPAELGRGGDAADATPGPGRRTGRKSTAAPTLREQQLKVDELGKENFSLKLEVQLLKDKLMKLDPDAYDEMEKRLMRATMERYERIEMDLREHRRLLREQHKALRDARRDKERLVDDLEEARRKAQEAEESSQREREERERLENELREAKEKGSWEEDPNASQAEISYIRSDLEAERERKEEAIQERDELRQQVAELEGQVSELRRNLEETTQTLLEADEERRRERRRRKRHVDVEGEGGGDSSDDDGGRSALSGSVGVGEGGGRREVSKLRRQIAVLEQDKAALESQVEEQDRALVRSEEDREALLGEKEDLEMDLRRLRERLDELEDREAARKEGLEGDVREREDLEENIGVLRDKLAETQLVLQEKEQELDEVRDQQEEFDEQLRRHNEEMDEQERKWSNLVSEKQEELEDVRDQHNAVSADFVALQEEHARLSDEKAQLQMKSEEYHDALVQLAEEANTKEAELEAAREEIDVLNAEVAKYSEQAQAAEEELEETSQAYQSLHDEHESSKVKHEEIVARLKDKIANLEYDHDVLAQDMQELESEHQSLLDRIGDLEDRIKVSEEKRRADAETMQKLRDQLEDLEADLRAVEEEKDRAHETWENERADLLEKWNKIVDEKEKIIADLKVELATSEDRVATRTSDLERVEKALRQMESDSRRLGESITNDRFSLELEVDRLKRDLARCEADVERLRKEVERRDEMVREKDETVSKLHAENRDLSSQLASQTQSRLGLSDRLDSTQQTLRDVQAELVAARDRVQELEGRMSRDQRAITMSEREFRDQLSERNTLLLTVYQYISKIVSDGKPAGKGGSSEPKPFANFAVFHESLTSRLKNLAQIQLSFDRRVKEVEAKLGEQFATLKRQQESRLRQLDRFETAIKNATNKQGQWRQRLITKQGELEAAKSTNAELLAQISSLRTRTALASPAENSKITSLTSRANNAERRLMTVQNQASSAEEQLNDTKRKFSVAEGKWQARIKELEIRNKAAEERVKRERQGGKERVVELQETVAVLEKQLETLKR